MSEAKKDFLPRSQTRPTSLGSRLKKLRLAAAHSLRSHVCEPRSIFADVHAAGKNVLNFLCACGRKLCEASLAGLARGLWERPEKPQGIVVSPISNHYLYIFLKNVKVMLQIMKIT